MGFFKNVAKGTARVVGRETKKSAKKAARKVGGALFGQTYTKVAKKARSRAIVALLASVLVAAPVAHAQDGPITIYGAPNGPSVGTAMRSQLRSGGAHCGSVWYRVLHSNKSHYWIVRADVPKPPIQGDELCPQHERGR